MKRLRLADAFFLAALAVAPTAAAQDGAKVARIGLLSPLAPTTEDGLTIAFRDGLRELGYKEGETVKLQSRWADGNFDRLPALAQELADLGLDVIVASLTQAALAAKAASASLPIVMAGVGDPVGAGLVASLARPGGNVTGTSGLGVEIVGKQLELLSELAPGVSRIAVLRNPANLVFQSQLLRETAAAARASRLELQVVEAREPGAFETAFAAIAREDTRALLILGDPMFGANFRALAELAAQRRLPTVGATRRFPEAGGLVGYGPNYRDLHRRAATHVHRILKGARPGDLPVEQPTTFELVVNLRSARALGIPIPPAILARADEVIE